MFCVSVVVGKGVNVEGAVPSEQEVNQPKPAKRARTSFTADQLQVKIDIFGFCSVFDKTNKKCKLFFVND